MVVSSIGGNQKNSQVNKSDESGMGIIVILLLVKTFLVKEAVWDGALLLSSNQFLCRQISGEFSQSFTQSPKRCRSSLRNWFPGLPGRIICEQSLNDKEYDKHALTLLVTSRWVWMFPFKHSCMAHAVFPERLSNHSQVLHRTFSRFTQNLMHIMSYGSRNIIRLDSQLQIKGRKNQNVRPAEWNVVYGLQR